MKKPPDVDTFGFIQAMGEMDELSLIFANLPKYRSPQGTKAFLEKLLTSGNMDTIKAIEPL